MGSSITGSSDSHIIALTAIAQMTKALLAILWFGSSSLPYCIQEKVMFLCKSITGLKPYVNHCVYTHVSDWISLPGNLEISLYSYLCV